MRFGIQISTRIAALDTLADWIVEVGEPAGLDSVWGSESYAWDSFTPIAFMAARTKRVRLCTGITAIPARTPTSVAMTVITLDHLSKGRVTLGLGVSGPRVAEGWYGQSFAAPLKRTREYVAIIRAALKRQGRLDYQGTIYRIPADGAEGLRSKLVPFRDDVPILLGVQGPKNTSLSAEIADGMVTGWYAPEASAWLHDRLGKGFEAAGLSAPPPNFEIATVVDVHLAATVSDAADYMRPRIAFAVARMGPVGQNFYYDTFARLGYAELCDRIVAEYDTAGGEAASALVPDDMAEQVALLGPVEKIHDDIDRWEKSGVTTMVFRGDDADVTTLLAHELS